MCVKFLNMPFRQGTEKDEKKARRNSKEEKEAKEDQQKRNAEKDGKGEKKGQPISLYFFPSFIYPTFLDGVKSKIV